MKKPKHIDNHPFKVGQLVVMVKAGGWGYNQDNNGCIAVVNAIGIRNNRYCISGEVINPNSASSYNTFNNVPVLANGVIVCLPLTDKEHKDFIDSKEEIEIEI